MLEPSILIKKCPGIPDLMKHRGYRLCGDNINKSIHTRHKRLDRRNKSLHYFHLYAVENRVDFASLIEAKGNGKTSFKRLNDIVPD